MSTIYVMGLALALVASGVALVKASNPKPILKPYVILHGWLVRKRVERGNKKFDRLEKGDIVLDGITKDNIAFAGEWLGDISGNGSEDMNNYNSPVEYQLNEL